MAASASKVSFSFVFLLSVLLCLKIFFFIIFPLLYLPNVTNWKKSSYNKDFILLYLRSILDMCSGASDPSDLAERLTPKGFEVGCKRMTPSDEYVKGETSHVVLFKK